MLAVTMPRLGRGRLARFLAARGLLVAIALVMALAIAATPAARAQIAGRAEAAAPPLRIGVFVSSRTDRCYDPGDVAAVTAMAKAEEARINEAGGIAGRPLQVRILDDGRDPERAVANVRWALDDPEMLAMVGLSGSDRAKAVFDALGKEIGDRRIPFLSSISVDSIISGYPHVFTTQSTQDDERIPVMVEFVRHMGFERAAFVGSSETVLSRALGDGLKRALGDRPLVADHRLAEQNGAFDAAGMGAAVADLAEKRPDVLVLGFGGERATAFLGEMIKASVTPSVFVSGRIEMLPKELTDNYPNAFYQLAWDRLPEADNDRLRKIMAKDPAERWIFEGAKVPEAPGWSKGTCEARPAGESDPMASANMRAVGVGSIASDMIAMIAAVAAPAKANSDLVSLRRLVTDEIKSSYATGQGAFKGRFDNWSFHPVTRAASRTPFVVILPRGLGRTQLAPVQFIRVRDGSLRKIETLYLDIDLVRAHHVEDNEKTFFAEFYLSMRNGAASSIEQIEFTNGYVDPRTNGRQVSIERLHDGGPSNTYPNAMKVYKVTGRFVFEPELESYPFDTQRFSIDIQPKRGDAPFIVQPPPAKLRDKQVATDGWDQKVQYAGYDEDFIPLIDAYTYEPSVVPFYKASFVWLMKRQTTDYYLRVVVPLAFILVVAYLSIFIPISHFEAIVTIQVTALLSAVALYLSLPKIDSDTATVSDRIFVFNYMMVSLMIIISIMRMNPVVTARRWLKGTLWATHVFIMPLMVAAAAWLVYQVSIRGVNGTWALWTG